MRRRRNQIAGSRPEDIVDRQYERYLDEREPSSGNINYGNGLAYRLRTGPKLPPHMRRDGEGFFSRHTWEQK
jgi:hypothetical protein